MRRNIPSGKNVANRPSASRSTRSLKTHSATKRSSFRPLALIFIPASSVQLRPDTPPRADRGRLVAIVFKRDLHALLPRPAQQHAGQAAERARDFFHLGGTGGLSGGRRDGGPIENVRIMRR